jgi:hypothetical protein
LEAFVSGRAVYLEQLAILIGCRCDTFKALVAPSLNILVPVPEQRYFQKCHIEARVAGDSYLIRRLFDTELVVTNRGVVQVNPELPDLFSGCVCSGRTQGDKRIRPGCHHK